MKNPFKRNGLEVSVQQDYQYHACQEVQEMIDKRMKDCGYPVDDPNDVAVMHYGFYYFIEFPREAEELYEKYGNSVCRAFIEDKVK